MKKLIMKLEEMHKQDLLLAYYESTVRVSTTGASP